MSENTVIEGSLVNNDATPSETPLPAKKFYQNKKFVVATVAAAAALAGAVALKLRSNDKAEAELWTEATTVYTDDLETPNSDPTSSTK